jgi:hypothetical protein
VTDDALERDMMIAAATVSSNRPADHNASPSIRGCAPTTGLCAFVTMVTVTSNDRWLLRLSKKVPPGHFFTDVFCIDPAKKLHLTDYNL